MRENVKALHKAAIDLAKKRKVHISQLTLLTLNQTEKQQASKKKLLLIEQLR